MDPFKGEMSKASHSDRLAELVQQARRLVQLARPTTAYILRVLDSLTPGDVEQLGKWELDKIRSEAIVDRITHDLGKDRAVIYEVLGRCLRLDVWTDCLQHYSAQREMYLKSGTADTKIKDYFGRPPAVYTYLHHRGIDQWNTESEAASSCMLIEDNEWAAICSGYLVHAGFAFPTTLALLETAMSQQWKKWPLLWRYF